VAAPAKAGKPGKTPRGAPRTLYVTSGALSGTTIPLTDQPITLGRASDNTIVLNDDYASNYHARLRPYEGRWLVEDLGSTNGTYLDKQKVTSPSVVPIGVPVKVGKTLLELRK
jgi:pSer/pThr/pTyr-binding forkhead associated (FHA) protein